MNISDRIFDMLKQRGLTQSELATHLNTGTSTITGWKQENRNPSINLVMPICEFLNVSPEYLLTGKVENQPNSQLIERVINLNAEDVQKLNQFLDWISSTPKETVKPTYKRKTTHNVIPFPKVEKSSDVEFSVLRPIIKYQLPVSAGNGQFLDSDDYEIVDVGNEVPLKATFGVDITGDSMEPDYPDGSTAWVKRQEVIDNGQIGVFILNGEGFIKKYRKADNGIELISINPKYKPIEISKDDNLRCYGLVLAVTI